MLTMAARSLLLRTQLEKRTLPEGWASTVGVDEREVAGNSTPSRKRTFEDVTETSGRCVLYRMLAASTAAVALLREWAGENGQGGKLLELSIRADPFQHRANSTPASTTGSESSSSRAEPETPAILQQLLSTGQPSPVSIRDFLPI